MTITAVVPVRAGSRRLRNKNLLPFAGTTLLEHKLRILREVDGVDRILVSSDSPEMLAIGARLGALTHEREPEYADDVSRTFPEVVRHVVESVEGDHILWAFATAPLVTADTFQDAIDTYHRVLAEGYDSLVSVKRFQEHLWDDEGPVNYEWGAGHVLSQDLPPYYTMSEGIFLAPRQEMVAWSYFHGTRPYRFVVDKWAALDVNDELDLECARAWLDRRPSPSGDDA